MGEARDDRRDRREGVGQQLRPAAHPFPFRPPTGGECWGEGGWHHAADGTPHPDPLPPLGGEGMKRKASGGIDAHPTGIFVSYLTRARQKLERNMRMFGSLAKTRRAKSLYSAMSPTLTTTR